MPLSNIFGKKKQSLDELQEENDRLEMELSVEQKRAMLAKLRANGLSVNKDFGGKLADAWRWFKSH